MQVFEVSRVKIHFSLFETDLRECLTSMAFHRWCWSGRCCSLWLICRKKKVLSKLDIRKFM